MLMPQGLLLNRDITQSFSHSGPSYQGIELKTLADSMLLTTVTVGFQKNRTQY